MARTPKKLGIGQIASTDLTTIYTIPTNIATRFESLILTSEATVSLSIKIFYNDGSTDFRQDTMTVPPGRQRGYWDLDKGDPGDIIKLQADSAGAFNFALNGSEVEL